MEKICHKYFTLCIACIHTQKHHMSRNKENVKQFLEKGENDDNNEGEEEALKQYLSTYLDRSKSYLLLKDCSFSQMVKGTLLWIVNDLFSSDGGGWLLACKHSKHAYTSKWSGGTESMFGRIAWKKEENEINWIRLPLTVGVSTGLWRSNRHYKN